MRLFDDPDLLRGLLEGLPEALVVADTGGVIRGWNAAAARLFGHSREEAVGASLDLILPERFKPAHDAGFARAVATGELRVGGRVMRTRAVHKSGGKLYVDFSFALLKDARTGRCGLRDRTRSPAGAGCSGLISAAAARSRLRREPRRAHIRPGSGLAPRSATAATKTHRYRNAG